MTSEFCLSEKIYSENKEYWDKYDNIISFFGKFCKNKTKQEEFMSIIDDLFIEKDFFEEKDIKEFIRLLKEEMKNNQRVNIESNVYFLDIIDKLAGKNLI